VPGVERLDAEAVRHATSADHEEIDEDVDRHEIYACRRERAARMGRRMLLGEHALRDARQRRARPLQRRRYAHLPLVEHGLREGRGSTR
jgi:hypothetical protein